MDVVAGAFQLVRPVAEHPVEDGPADGDEPRVGDPGAVEAVLRLAFLVEPDLGQCRLLRPVVPAGDLGGHAADGVGAALVAGADQEFGVGAQEGGGHGDGGPVGEDEVGAVREVLDQAEEVVPAARVEAGAVFAQLVEDLLHLERGGDRLDEDGGTDRAAGDVQQLLGEEEDVVPEAGLVPVLQLGQVEVRSTAGVELPPGAVEEVEAEVDQGGGNGPFVDDEVLLREMPAPGPDHDGGGPVGEPVLLAGLAGEVDAPVDGVDQGQLALDDVLPGGRGGVLEVRHPHLGTGAQGVDRHPPVGRAGDLHPAVGEARGGPGDPPVGVLADRLGGPREVERGAAAQQRGAAAALGQQVEAAGGEGRV
ncbi:hypothetical protein Smic_00580 [Streptomyces microflavus]|uniref:Uncharacterized protein n=1 Tax=Streptomyces microflavus TaxID=1919 RepID=A0A7J0CGB3_STRMI|nr:hypothetical protein Smic_00580 [Streptomyces microflavus]